MVDATFFAMVRDALTDHTYMIHPIMPAVCISLLKAATSRRDLRRVLHRQDSSYCWPGQEISTCVHLLSYVSKMEQQDSEAALGN